MPNIFSFLFNELEGISQIFIRQLFG